MSLLGSIETFNLSTILQRIEAHAKTGLLVIKQNERWVELYFRQGQLMCIGPIRSNITLGERLLQAGVISQQALQEAEFTLGETQLSETRVALTLIDLGHVNHEGLYSWAAKEATRVIQTLLSWKTGELYFEDAQQPPPDRLLIAISIGSLLFASTSVEAIPQTEAEAATFEQEQASIARSAIPDSPTLYAPSQFFNESSADQLSASSFLLQDSPIPLSNAAFSSSSLNSVSLSPPKKVTVPLTPRRIDTSFMKPQMVLLPVDLSDAGMQNAEIQLTPEQWRILTRADGHTTLQKICSELAMSSDMVCQVAGELLALGLVTISMPPPSWVSELSPVSRNLVNSGLANGYVAPGYAASTMQPWVAVMPSTENMRPFSSTGPIETQSQWGNGGNGATFVLGGGWVLASQPLQAVRSSGPIKSTRINYAQVEGVH